MDRIREKQAIEAKLARCRELAKEFPHGATAQMIRDMEEEFPPANPRTRKAVGPPLAATERWIAILTIVIETPRDADRLRKNPLGVYVNAINWSKEVGQ
jgi:hypothetical protein